MPGVYRIEVSSTNRAGCKNKECKDAGIKIFKGQLRFGTFVTTEQFQSFHWRHWGCVTPKQIVNIKDAVDSDAANLDGYDELPEDLQEKIAQALEEGHVADEDWGGDVEMNRPGKNGFRTPETKKARKEVARAQEGDPGTPSHSPTKKRSHVKNDADADNADDAEESGPPAKKKKTTVKNERKVKKEDASAASGDEAQPVKTGRKKATKVKSEASPAMKEEDLGDDAAPLPPTKNARATRKAAAAKKVKDEDVEPDASVQAPEGNQPPPAKKTRAPRKAKTTKKIKDEETDNDDLSEDYESAPPVKKTRAPRKTAATKKIKAEEADEVPTVTKKTRAPRKKSATNHVEDQGENTAEASNGAAESSAEVPEVSSKAQVGEGPESEAEPEPETGASEAPVKPKKGGKKGGKKAVKKAAKGK